MKPWCAPTLGLVIACGPSEERFAEDYATYFCEGVATCEETQAALYGTPTQCQDAVMTLIGASTEAALSAEDCSFSSANAADCLEAMDGITCAFIDGVRACDNIYVGDGCADANTSP